MFGPVWISPLKKSNLVSKIWISPLEKSINAYMYAHIWVCLFWNPVMCIYAFIYRCLQWRNPYFRHLLGFMQWRNPNWCHKYGFLHWRNPYMHTYMHIFAVSKYVHVCKQILISLMEKPKFFTPVWISPLGKSKTGAKHIDLPNEEIHILGDCVDSSNV